MATASHGAQGRPAGQAATRNLIRAFEARARRVRAAGRRVRDPRDAGAVHDLRVAIRRLSELLWLWKPALRGAGLGGLRRRLGRVRRRLGPAREAEVHRSLAARLRLAPGDPGFAARAALIERLERRRGALRLEAAGAAGRMGIGKRLRRAAQAIAGLTVSEIAASEVEGRLAWRGARAIAALEAARTAGDPPHLHLARVALKRWRYAIEGAAALRAGRRSGRELAELAGLQETLGAVQDLALLKGLLEPPEGVGDAALGAMRARVAERLERREGEARRALEDWLARRAAAPVAVAQRRTTRNAGAAPSPGRARRGAAGRGAG